MVARARARLGTVLRDKWRLDGLLGVGGMASVFAATHRNGTRAAVKILHPELTVNALSRQRFLAEGHAANAVGHPGAVHILDDDVAEDGSLFLVTELLDGETLEHRRVRLGGRLPEEEVLLAIDQVLDVLVAAHAQGVVHRDLKPENLFLTRSGQIKVLDFGIARLRESKSASRLTQAGDAMGTPPYMAPEHARGLWDEVDARSDLWSVGASMFHLLSGTVVHEGRTVNEQLLGAMTQPAAPLSTLAPATSAPVCALVDRALAFEKDARWPDAATMRAALRSAYEDAHGTPISLALPLSVDGGVPDRSVLRLRRSPAPVDSPAPPPAIVRVALRPARWKSDSLQTAVAAVALALAVLGTVVLVGLGRAPRAPAAAAGSVPPAFLAPPPPKRETPPAVLEKLPEPGPPEMAATDLPVAPPPPTDSAKAPSAPRRDCSPPYVVDGETGKKRWKIECL
jgi:serine/threonine-protein kinase